jgi:toxin ParE1/3/4
LKSGKSHPVYWSHAARADLAEIIEYIAQDSSQTTLKVLEALENETEKPGRFPKSGRIIPELKKHNIYKYRELIHAPWRIFYKLEETNVFVLAVIDGRRNVEDLLLARQLR